MCANMESIRIGVETMGLLRIALARKRWDLAAHTIVLATATVLKNGDKPPASKSGRSLRIGSGSGVGRVEKSNEKEFERKKRRPKG